MPAGPTGTTVTTHRATRTTSTTGATGPAIHAVATGLACRDAGRAITTGRPIPARATGSAITVATARTAGTAGPTIRARRGPGEACAAHTSVATGDQDSRGAVSPGNSSRARGRAAGSAGPDTAGVTTHSALTPGGGHCVARPTGPAAVSYTHLTLPTNREV